MHSGRQRSWEWVCRLCCLPGRLAQGRVALLAGVDSQHLILVVEDDDLTRAFLLDNFAADGFRVAGAAGAGEALRAIEVRQPALVVLDLGLEDGSGLVLLDRVKAADGLSSRIDPDLPVIVLTGRSGDADRVRSFARGADDHLNKPMCSFVFRGVEAHLRAPRAVDARRRVRRPTNCAQIAPSSSEAGTSTSRPLLRPTAHLASRPPRPASSVHMAQAIPADARTAAPVPRGWPVLVRSSAQPPNPSQCSARGEALAPLKLGLRRLLEVHLPDLDLTGAGVGVDGHSGLRGRVGH
jgi:DNA-binding response OmpR family regulator